MGASANMPYFIKPSVSLSPEEKEEAYEQVLVALTANLEGVDDSVAKMATINCILKTYLPYYYWVGFYIWKNGRLEVGPYQGTLGCLYIDLGKGVCGKAAQLRQTQIVEDCHALAEGTDHITCDPNSLSEIVVPVIDQNEKLIAVLDVDSTLPSSFDQIDKDYLEKVVAQFF